MMGPVMVVRFESHPIVARPHRRNQYTDYAGICITRYSTAALSRDTRLIADDRRFDPDDSSWSN
jgi:hypothetical protein